MHASKIKRSLFLWYATCTYNPIHIHMAGKDFLPVSRFSLFNINSRHTVNFDRNSSVVLTESIRLSHSHSAVLYNWVFGTTIVTSYIILCISRLRSNSLLNAPSQSLTCSFQANRIFISSSVLNLDSFILDVWTFIYGKINIFFCIKYCGYIHKYATHLLYSEKFSDTFIMVT